MNYRSPAQRLTAGKQTYMQAPNSELSQFCLFVSSIGKSSSACVSSVFEVYDCDNKRKEVLLRTPLISVLKISGIANNSIFLFPCLLCGQCFFSGSVLVLCVHTEKKMVNFVLSFCMLFVAIRSNAVLEYFQLYEKLLFNHHSLCTKKLV